jgi:hypothetical protein
MGICMNIFGASVMAAGVGAACGQAAAASATDIETRMLAQEGLAIALASNVLQSQLNILDAAEVGSKSCRKLPDVGSIQLTSLTVVSKNVSDADVTVFFDRTCSVPYIEAQAKITSTNKGYLVAGSAAYLGLKGQSLGTLTLTESATQGAASTVLIGLGQFTPLGGAPTVDLGLECTLPNSLTGGHCEGGIAQPFPTLNLSLASVTPLTLTFTKTGSVEKVTFSGSGSNRQTGAMGSLSIDEASKTALGISGSGTAYGPAATSGTAANFILFPPTPTHWLINDKAHGAKFSLKVDSNATRNSTGTITDTATAATLATIQVDQSGTGTIAYAGESTVPVTGWLLSD